MSDYGWVEQITTSDLSNRALVLLSRFARLLKQVNGDILDLQNPRLSKNVVRYGTTSNDARVKALFEDLLIEFHIMIENKGQPHYRGTVLNKLQSDEITTKEPLPSVSDSNKKTLYRGVPLELKKTNDKSQIPEKKITYRGVEVSVDD